MPSIIALNRRVCVEQALSELSQHEFLWNEYDLRTTQYNSPHDVSDIWLRYNAWENYTGDHAAFNERHESVWYPGADYLPAVRNIVSYVYGLVDGKELGGVLITKIAPGSKVLPHVDKGWHAGYYTKYAVQLRGNQEQTFGFADAELRPEPGDVYTFDNSVEHWVNNDSTEDRVTLIICIRQRNNICRGQ